MPIKALPHVEITDTKPTRLCHCGKPLHYMDKDVEDFVNKMIQKHGENIEVTSNVSKITYIIPRHYIALHGLKESELATLGFPIKEGTPPESTLSQDDTAPVKEKNSKKKKKKFYPSKRKKPVTKKKVRMLCTGKIIKKVPKKKRK